MKKLLLLVAALPLFSGALLAQSPEVSGPMAQMQTKMQAMQEQMARIRATEDPEERQRLMQEHMQSMHEGMMTMGQMMRGPMAQGQMRECQQADTECRMNQMQLQQQMMGQRMGMMQQMMQQMMEQMMQGQAPDVPEGESHEEHHPQ